MIYRRLYNYPTISFHNTFEQLENMRRQIDRLFGDESGGQGRLSQAGVFPLINLTEDVDKFYLRAELAGVKSDDIEIQATAKSISVAGERKIEPEDKGIQYHRREREAGKFSRIITMPVEIDPDRIEAKLEEGILTVLIPKAEAVKPRQITIS